jgi:hypothetical protein
MPAVCPHCGAALASPAIGHNAGNGNEALRA